MLDHYEFKALPLNDQAQYIWDNGTYLANRAEGDFNINLYHLRTFFAEVWYENDQNEITTIRTFTSYNCLDDYSDLIDISY